MAKKHNNEIDSWVEHLTHAELRKYAADGLRYAVGSGHPDVREEWREEIERRKARDSKKHRNGEHRVTVLVMGRGKAATAKILRLLVDAGAYNNAGNRMLKGYTIKVVTL